MGAECSTGGSWLIAEQFPTGLQIVISYHMAIGVMAQ